MHSVLVTGGSRGLGLGIAKKLALGGYQVIVVARQESEQLLSCMQEVRNSQKGVIQFRAFDLTEVAALPDLVKAVNRDFGPLYGLVNNAGLGASGVLAITPDDLIERLLRLNIHSPILLTKYVVRSMMVSGGSRIVNISSIVSATGYAGLSVYSATKAALVGFTRSLAREVGPLGIAVNAVAPGFVDTDMTREMKDVQREQIIRRSALHRLPQVEDIAHAVAFLLSSEAASITGTVMTVDAGNTV